jgi:CRISP-associated protein Cas1
MSSMIGAKIRNKGYLLKNLAKKRNNEHLLGQAERIMSQAEKIKERAEEWGYIEEARESLFGIEGEASRIYFQALSNILPEAVYSGTRRKQPPETFLMQCSVTGTGFFTPRSKKPVSFQA